MGGTLNHVFNIDRHAIAAAHDTHAIRERRFSKKKKKDHSESTIL